MLLSGITVAVTFILGFLWWIYQPSDQVPMWLFSVCFILFYIVCMILYALLSRENAPSLLSPRVISIKKYGEKQIIVLEKNELFRQGLYVTITYQEEKEEAEILLGLGYVETVTNSGLIQVIFERQEGNEQAKAVIASLEDTRRCKEALIIGIAVPKRLIWDERWEYFGR